MVLVSGTVTHATILTPARESSLTMLFSRDLHMFSLPESMDTFLIHCPTALRQQLVNASRSEARALTSQQTHLTEQTRFIVCPTRLIPLGVAWLTQNAAGTTLRDSFWPQTATHGGYRASATFRAYQFPLAASLRISISRACSATIFFSLAFSFSRASSCLAISGFMPPYF